MEEVSDTVTIILDRAGRPRARRVPRASVVVTEGPDRRNEVEFGAGRLQIGTSDDAGLRLTDDTVSAIHCELAFAEDGLWVKDLGSKNGVFLKGVRVREALLQKGLAFSLGRTTMQVRLTGEDTEPLEADAPEGVIGRSIAMRVLFAQLRRAAASDAPVLISGEVGSGKEVAAEALVAMSPRQNRPFVVLDCRAIVETLAESELFGHEGGAFTGATRQRQGVFERAQGGTLLLDEIGELPPAIQARLLGVLQRRSFQRVGGDTAVDVDVRVLATTVHELPRLVNAGTFRPDLYFRLAALELRVPALRERREDIPLLVSHFLERLKLKSALPPAMLDRLCGREYAGNVAELRNAVERAAHGIEPTAPPGLLAAGEIDLSVPYAMQKQRVLDGFERAYVLKLLESAKGNVSAAARAGGMNRVHLHELIARLGLKGVV